MNKKALLIQQRYGGILVSLTYIDDNKENVVCQINYIIPKKMDNGEFLNDDIKDVLVGKNNFILSDHTRDISQYIKILGEEPKIEFSKMSKANIAQIKYLSDILRFYKKDIYKKKEEFSHNIKKIYEFSHNGNIYMFDKEVDKMKRIGIKINNVVLSELRHQCYSGR